MRLGYVGLGKGCVRLAKVWLVLFWTGLVKLGQVKLGKDRLGQVRTGWVSGRKGLDRMGYAKFGLFVFSQDRIGQVDFVSVRLCNESLGQIR